VSESPVNAASDSCPFIDLDDDGCAPQLTLGHLSQAFGLCLSRYRSCATYYKLSHQQPQRILLTAHGKPLQRTAS
jgi:hypothetical protein